MADEKDEKNEAPEPKAAGKAKSASSEKPVVAPDGHENLSQEDIDAREGG